MYWYRADVCTARMKINDIPSTGSLISHPPQMQVLTFKTRQPRALVCTYPGQLDPVLRNTNRTKNQVTTH